MCIRDRDGGDDPDATNGILICAAVERRPEEGIHIDGGTGVGRVTKPGLNQPAGNAVSYTHLDVYKRQEQIDALAAVSGVKVPEAIEEIRTAPVRHHTVAEVGGMEAAVKKILGLTD